MFGVFAGTHFWPRVSYLKQIIWRDFRQAVYNCRSKRVFK